MKKKLSDELIGRLNRLKDSIPVNNSLGSNELFHSDWLISLLNHENQLIESLFGVTLNGPIRVHREKQHIDIKIENETDCVNIENKVKDIPRKDQLNKYQSGAANRKQIKRKQTNHWILLSMVRPWFFEGDSWNGWKWVSYSHVCEVLTKYADKLPQGLLRLYLEEYIKFVATLLQLYQEIKITDYESVFLDEYSMEILQDLRIHALFYKYRYSDLADRLRDRLEKMGERKIICDHHLLDKADINTVLVENNYFRGTGLFDFYVPIFESRKHNVFMGVELHDNSLKLFISTNDQSFSLKVSENLMADKIWFDFMPAKKRGISLGEYTVRKEFSQYNDGLWLYKAVKVEDITQGEIIDLMCEYFSYIRKNHDCFQKACEDVEKHDMNEKNKKR